MELNKIFIILLIFNKYIKILKFLINYSENFVKANFPFLSFSDCVVENGVVVLRRARRPCPQPCLLPLSVNGHCGVSCNSVPASLEKGSISENYKFIGNQCIKVARIGASG